MNWNWQGAPAASKPMRARSSDGWARSWRWPTDAPVMVSDLTCTEPGCPPMETVFSVSPEGQPSFLVKLASP